MSIISDLINILPDKKIDDLLSKNFNKISFSKFKKINIENKTVNIDNYLIEINDEKECKELVKFSNIKNIIINFKELSTLFTLSEISLELCIKND